MSTVPYLVAAAIGASLLAPASANAGVSALGSNLTHPADTIEAHGADSAFWNLAIGGAPGAMPANGQVTLVRVKGSVRDDPLRPRNPNPLFHVQVLRPIGGGTVRVDRTSAGFLLPVGGDTEAINSFVPVNLCVRKGDFVDFNDIGGFEFRWGDFGGMAFQAFSGNATGSSLAFFTKNQGTNNGAQFAPDPSFAGGDEELLMQTVLATGPDATDMCLGGYRQHVFKGLQIAAQSQTLKASTSAVPIKTQCPGPSYGSCQGTLTLQAPIAGKRTTLGSVAFNVKPSNTATLTVKLTTANLKAVQKAGKVVATAVASAHDNPALDTRAASNKPPVQSAVTRGAVTVTPDRRLSPPPDSDGDGMANAWEQAHGLNPSTNDAAGDPDADGLTNLQEYRIATDPKRADSDGDGFRDKRETLDGTDPLDASSHRPRDTDADGRPDASDNCAKVANASQADTDLDRTGDACDPDDDNDGVPDSADRCAATFDPSQTDTDGDRQGDACDRDDDGDGVADGASDNCPLVANADQTDSDRDRAGDACDLDDDNDGVGDATDNCALVRNPGQANNDGDALGDACDPDDDNDGVGDATDNCARVANESQTDTDKDGLGDACDPDDDNDGVDDSAPDNCPLVSNADQLDTDQDGEGDACDPDDDNDGVVDTTDNCALVPNRDQVDTDQDGEGDACDSDDDGDGIADDFPDNCPTTSNFEQSDRDGDGVGDVCDAAPDDPNAR